MDGKSMFGDIKSKLGFGRKNDYEEFYEDYEEFEEGDDYGEYGYDESYERTSGSAYDPYDSVTTREPGERSRSRSSMPRLVSIDDVRARTAVPTLPDDDAPATRRGSSSSFRTMVDSSLPPQMTPEGTAAASAAASAVHHARSEGLNSLFESTTPPADTRSTSSRGSSASSSRFTPSRTLKVVAPGAYNDAEAVSTALKLGNAVVLNLAATPDALAKRILDFSFGVASALDANVECVGNKVFALTRIDELTEAERSYLRVRLANAYSMIIFIYVMMSWLPNTQSGIIGDIYRALGKLCDPYLNLFRKLIPPLGGMVDVTPIIALLVLQFGVRLLVMIF